MYAKRIIPSLKELRIEYGFNEYDDYDPYENDYDHKFDEK